MAAYFVTQAGAGTRSGLSLGNAFSISDHNSATFTSGDTISLNGVLTSQLIVPSSGSAGNIITYTFANGAKFSAPTWTTGSSAGVFMATSKSYITIDGGVNGIMEATDNGSALTFQNEWLAVWLEACDHCTVQNLTIQNMFVRPAGATQAICGGVKMQNTGNNMTVTNCVINYAVVAVIGYFQGTTKSTLVVSNNTITYCAIGLFFGDGGANSSFTGVTFSGNYFDHTDIWHQASGNAHAEGIHLYATQGGTSSISTILVSSNYFGKFSSAEEATAHVYLEDSITGSPLIINNVFVQQSSQAISNGAIYNKCTATTNILNNTFISDGGCIAIEATSTGCIAKNNICFMHNDWFQVSTATCDYNDIYLTPSSSASEGAHSITTNPNLNGTYGLNAGSPCIETGLDLSGTFTIDKNGVTRTVPWDIGAFKFGVGATSQAIKRISRYLRLWGPAN